MTIAICIVVILLLAGLVTWGIRSRNASTRGPE